MSLQDLKFFGREDAVVKGSVRGCLRTKFCFMRAIRGRESKVGIATSFVLKGPGIESR
jgi:hypothetical protein